LRRGRRGGALSRRIVLGHLSFGVTDIERAIAFYDIALAPLGPRPRVDEPERRRLRLSRRRRFAGPEATRAGAAPPGAGFHLAFNATSRAAVDAFHAEALRAGGTDNGAPGLRPHYGPTYYAAFRDRP
jgi:catechol 2,3-dioxygenase-like lactoylglutathione lyase family enzyme